MNSNLVKSVLGSMVIGLVIFVLLLSLAPDAVPYSGNNYGWNGMQQVDTTFHVTPITSLSSAVPGPRSVLLIVAPTAEFSLADALSALNFAKGGGTIVITDSSGYSNSLLANMSAHVFIAQNVVEDPLYNWKSPRLPIALIYSNVSVFAHVNALAFDDPSSLIVTSSAVIVGTSSPYSSAYSISSSGAPGKLLRSGPLPIVAMESIGQGRLIVIGGSAFFTDSVWENADNQVFASNLLSNSTVYIDTSHWPVNVGESLKAQFLALYSIISSGPYRYLFALVSIGVTLAIFPVFSVALVARPRSAPTATIRHNEKILNKIRKDRERYGAS
ncbi:MAG: DUF4350 domain-containing protein [Nitrososphaerales archaeon]